jgi:hypothetical protein
MPKQGAYLDRHLEVVRELCSAWNWYPLDSGRVIWAQVTPRVAQQSEPLPVRVPGWFSYPEPDEPVTALSDLDFMRRVRDGLYNMDTERGHCGEL